MRRVAGILVVAVVLASVGLVAGPAAAKGGARSTFTIEQPTLILADPGVMNHVGDIRGAVHIGDIVSSDARVAGQITTVVNVSWIRLGPPNFDYEARMWGTFRIENDTGSWEGTWTGYRGPGWETGVHIIDSVGKGAGAYKGLHIEFQMEDWAGTGEILDPGSH